MMGNKLFRFNCCRSSVLTDNISFENRDTQILGFEKGDTQTLGFENRDTQELGFINRETQEFGFINLEFRQRSSSILMLDEKTVANAVNKVITDDNV